MLLRTGNREKLTSAARAGLETHWGHDQIGTGNRDIKRKAGMERGWALWRRMLYRGEEVANILCVRGFACLQ